MIFKVVDGIEFDEKVLQAILIGLLAALLFIYRKDYNFHQLMDSLASVGGTFTKEFRNKMMLGRWAPRTAEQEEAVLKRGGYVGGLVNDGNTCFMNSVLQSLASSRELLEFMDEHIINANISESNDDQEIKSHSNENLGLETERKAPISDKRGKAKKVYGSTKKHASRSAEENLSGNEQDKNIQFTIALNELLENLNAKHYRSRPWFKTNRLLKTMTKAPNKNIILGYDQEDAQEFFQTILSELEKNLENIYGKPLKDRKKIPESDLPNDAIIGQSDLGNIGDVYLPSDQIDPNSVLETNEKFYTPFKLVTPFDGITAERIGCLQCGENGGIRYSVFSGLSLNLPSENIGSTIKLSELLHEWSKPEIIEGVECNRCALIAVHEHLNQQLETIKRQKTVNEKFASLLENRITEVEAVLSKPAIDDDDYKKMHTENMVRKSSKSKQILISRPPPFLSLHINRSVFDPRTFTIRKNNSRVLFKSRINLSPWCCNYDEINLDARLPMSKKQDQWQESSEEENVGKEYYKKLHRRFEREFEEEEEEEEYESQQLGRTKDVQNYDPLNGEMMSSSYTSSDSELEGENEEDVVEVDALGNTVRRIANKSEPMLGGIQRQDPFLEGYPEDDPNEDDENDETGDDEEDDESSDVSEDSLPSIPMPSNEPLASTVPDGPLTYVLRSVIVHYGTHNYGHYIAFRKYRGCWWRISDESVYIVDEAEVLSTPGVFMLFYEYDYDENTGRMREDLEFENEYAVEVTEQDNTSIDIKNSIDLKDITPGLVSKTEEISGAET